MLCVGVLEGSPNVISLNKRTCRDNVKSFELRSQVYDYIKILQQILGISTIKVNDMMIEREFRGLDDIHQPPSLLCCSFGGEVFLPLRGAVIVLLHRER